MASALAPAQIAHAQDRKVRVSTPGPAITTLPTEVVRVKGFDKEEGLALNVTPSAGAIAVKAMVAGDFDFCLSVGAALIGAVNGAPVKVIYVHVDKWLYFLYAAAGISSLHELEGKRIAVDAAGGTLDVIVRRAMQSSGAGAGSTAFISMGNIGNVPAALIAGAVDAGVITPPQEFQLLHSARKFKNLGFLGDYAPGITGGIAAANKTLQEYPDMVRAFLKAHAKAHKFILDNREETIPIVSRFLNLSAEDAASAYDTTIRPFYTTGGAVSPEQQAVFIAELARGLKTTPVTDPKACFDFSFLPRA